MASSTRTELVLALTLTLASGATSAEGASPDGPRARALALEGRKAFDAGDFAGAILRYQEAWRLEPVPGLLFNLGQSYRRAREPQRALSYYRRYLETKPAAAYAAAVTTLITQLEAEERAAGDERARRAAREADTRRLGEEATRLQLLAQSGPAASARRVELELKRKDLPPPTPPITQRWWFWTGLGVVVAGAAITATVVATSPHPLATTFPDLDAR
jgi:tetratricopeptide (TPR) repeat protein